MELFLAIVYWISLAGVFQTYIGIHVSTWLILHVRSIFTNKEWKKLADDELPSVTVVIPARNEEAVIANKIQNLLDADYPREKLDVLIGSDCSTDRTVEIIRGFKNPRVNVVEMPHRRGKLGIVDDLTPRAKGEIVIITDSNVMFKSDAIKRLMRWYGDERVGGMAGNLIALPAREGSRLEAEISYRKFETFLKSMLGQMGITIGAYGGFYSLRRELFRPLGVKPFSEDVIIPLEVQAQGYKVFFDPQAIALEEVEGELKKEFQRRMRMIGYNIRSSYRGIKLSARAGLLALYSFFSYKVLRWHSSFLWTTLLLTSLLLMFKSPFHFYFALIMLGAIFVTFAGMISHYFRVNLPLATKVFHFVAVNIASMIGVFKLIRGIDLWWEPRA